MAFGGSPAVTRAVANNFIPELWSDEVIGAYKKNLVVANVVTMLYHLKQMCYNCCYHLLLRPTLVGVTTAHRISHMTHGAHMRILHRK